MAQVDSVVSTHSLSALPGPLKTQSADGSGSGCHLSWTYWGIYTVWTNGAETSADMSVHMFYTSSSHIWLLFLPMASGVCTSAAKGWLCSAVAQNHASLFCWAVREQRACVTQHGRDNCTLSCEKTAAILLYWAAVLLLPSPVTSPSHFRLWVVSGLHQFCSWKTELTQILFWSPTDPSHSYVWTFTTPFPKGNSKSISYLKY